LDDGGEEQRVGGVLKDGGGRAFKARGEVGGRRVSSRLLVGTASVDADDRTVRVVFNATCRLLSLPGVAHARFLTCREAPDSRPLRTAGTGLLAPLLGFKMRRHFLERAGVTPIWPPPNKILSAPL
jgi:hypothetical protein